MTTISTTLPRNLQKQIEEAKALMNAEPEETPEGNTAQPTPEPTSEVQGTDEGNTAQPTPAAEPVQTAEPTTEQPVQMQVEQPPVQTQDDATLQHKYSVLQGKYNADVRRLQSQVNDLKTQIEAMNTQPQAIAPTEQAPAKSPQPQQMSSEITDDMVRKVVSEDMIDEWGIDYWKTVLQAQQSLAPSKSQSTPDVLTQRLDQLESRDFYTELGQMVPDLVQIDDDPKFSEWLKNVEPLTGRSFYSILSEAESQRDSIRAAAIFDKYKAETAITKAQPQQKQTTPSVSSQVAPSGTPTTIQPAGESMSLSEWTRQKQTIALMAPTNPVKAGQLKQKLDAAMAEGRVLSDDGSPIMSRGA